MMMKKNQKNAKVNEAPKEEVTTVMREPKLGFTDKELIEALDAFKWKNTHKVAIEVTPSLVNVRRNGILVIQDRHDDRKMTVDEYVEWITGFIDRQLGLNR